MPPPFRSLTPAAFEDEVRNYSGRRRIVEIHMHHTWRPTHAQYRGHDTIVAMWRHHTMTNGWSDIAQHISIAPDGVIWSGRPWERSPASAKGYNGNAGAGPFMFEMIGNFDTGHDPFGGDQKEAVLHVVATLLGGFGLDLGALRFHNQLHPPGAPPPKTCPGSSIDYDAFINEVRARLNPQTG